MPEVKEFSALYSDPFSAIVKAEDAGRKPQSFLLISPPGGGKSTQTRTLPKPVLSIIFDPNGAAAIRGVKDVDRVEFLEEASPLRFPAVDERVGMQLNKGSRVLPTAYARFHYWLNGALASDLFSKYKSIVIDSITSLENAIAALVKYDHNVGTISVEQSTYVRDPLYEAIARIAAQPAVIMVTAHRKDKNDMGGKALEYDLLAIGRARNTIPGLFSEVLYLEHIEEIDQKTKQKVGRYIAKTKPDSRIHIARVSDHNLPAEIDMTIEDWDKPENYGVGKILKLTE